MGDRDFPGLRAFGLPNPGAGPAGGVRRAWVRNAGKSWWGLLFFR